MPFLSALSSIYPANPSMSAAGGGGWQQATTTPAPSSGSFRFAAPRAPQVLPTAPAGKAGWGAPHKAAYQMEQAEKYASINGGRVRHLPDGRLAVVKGFKATVFSTDGTVAGSMFYDSSGASRGYTGPFGPGQPGRY